MAIFAVIFLGAYFASICAVGYVVFSPFKHAIARPPTHDMRFTIVDLLATFLPFTLGHAALNGFYPDIDWNTGTSTFFFVTALVITGLSWFYGMRLLSRMRIDQSIKRIVLLGIVMPAGFVVPTVALPILFDVQSVYQLVYRMAIVACVVFGMRLLSLWIRAGDAAIAQ
jgi:hypothetical protein